MAWLTSVYSYNQMLPRHRRGRPVRRHAPGPHRRVDGESSRSELQHLCEEPASDAEFVARQGEPQGPHRTFDGIADGAHVPARWSDRCSGADLSLDEIEQRIEDVTIDDLHAIVAEFYAPARFNVAAVGADEATIRTALDSSSRLNPDLAAAPLAA